MSLTRPASPRVHPLLLVFLAGLTGAAWLTLRPDEHSRVSDQYMRAQEISTLFSGSVLVGQHGKVIFSGGYGYADIEHRIPNEPRTQFRIGSITKPFTGIAILQLQEAGLLSVDDPICLYLDPCPEHWSTLTIHHLLSHTSGIFNFTDSSEYLAMTAEPATRDEVISRFRDLPLRFEPGAQFEYSNSNFHLLGTIIENVTSKAYAQVLEERIFEPAGLIDTGFGSNDPDSDHFAIGYRSAEDGTPNLDYPVDVSWSFAAGGLYSTVEDLYRWDLALESDRLLSERAKTAMFLPVTETYGYAWTLQGASKETLGRAVRMHGGRIQGFTACFVRFTADDLTAIVLSNNVMADTCGVARDLAAIALDEDYAIPIARRAISLDRAILNRYVGNYRYTEDTTIHVRREDDRLIATTSQSPERFELFAESETEFFLKTFDLQVAFSMNRRGEATALTLRGQNRRVIARRIDD